MKEEKAMNPNVSIFKQSNISNSATCNSQHHQYPRIACVHRTHLLKISLSAMMDPVANQRRFKGKKRKRGDINIKHVEQYEDLQRRQLHGVLLGTTVYICTEPPVVHILDCLCLGNLDGGPGTAAHVRDLVAAAGVTLPGDRAVRLSIDEAFFMAHALQCLTVYDEIDGKGVPLDDEALWRRLCATRRDFIVLYVAYHHFRAKGWIPRTGLQYGVDFVLYQRHPALAHSDYSVVVLPRGAGTPRATAAELVRPEPCWHEIQITNRLTSQVGKRLLLLHVQHAAGAAADLTSPKCLQQFAVQERIVRRWVPEAQRPFRP
jgi:hypothetical protein